MEINDALLMDLYELTMANGYALSEGRDEWVTFDLFYRKNPDDGGFAIFTGLEQILEYLENLHFSPEDLAYLQSLHLFAPEFLDSLAHYRFSGTVHAVPEGTIVFPGEPLITVHAPLLDAQIIETALLNQINHQSLIATKARRMVRSAKGRAVFDFGARRAHGGDAALYGARAAYIGGVNGTATLSAGYAFGIPVSGTMAHSWVMFHDDEYTAFKRYAELYPDSTTLLVDTYDVLTSGIPNAIAVAKNVLEPMGRRLKGVRLDSGDLAVLSRETRALLDAAGLQDCAIVVSNSLDEHTIRSLLEQGACIDSFGVGERLITAKSDPVFGAVYKLVAVEKGRLCTPKIKVSETFEKITNPGRKKLWRVYDRAGRAKADLITGLDEQPDLSGTYHCVDPQKPWENLTFKNCRAVELQTKVISRGKRTGPSPSLDELRAYVNRQLETEIAPTCQRFDNPERHVVAMSRDYYRLKMDLLRAASPQNALPKP